MIDEKQITQLLENCLDAAEQASALWAGQQSMIIGQFEDTDKAFHAQVVRAATNALAVQKLWAEHVKEST